MAREMLHYIMIHGIVALLFIVGCADKEREHNRKMAQMTDTTEGRTLISLSKDIREKEGDAKQEALYYLGELKDERGVDLLIDVLLNDKEASARAGAALALGKIGSEAAIDSLMNAMHDEKIEVRVFVVEALGEIGGVMAMQALEDFLLDEDEEVSMTAIEELKRLRLK